MGSHLNPLRSAMMGRVLSKSRLICTAQGIVEKRDILGTLKGE